MKPAKPNTQSPLSLRQTYGSVGSALSDGFSACLGDKNGRAKAMKETPPRERFAKRLSDLSDFLLAPPEKPSTCSVDDLLAARPNRQQWNFAKRAFAERMAKRKTLRNRWLFLFFGAFPLVALPLLVFSFQNLEGAMAIFAGLLIASLPFLGFFLDDHPYYLEVEQYGSFFQRIYRNHPIPRLPGFETSHDLRDAEQVRLRKPALQDISESPSACAYLRGVAEQDVPLLRMDTKILRQLTKNDNERNMFTSLYGDGPSCERSTTEAGAS